LHQTCVSLFAWPVYVCFTVPLLPFSTLLSSANVYIQAYLNICTHTHTHTHTHTQVGPIADRMVEQGMPLTRVRKICQGVAFIGPAACMIGCAILTPYAIQSTAASAATQVGRDKDTCKSTHTHTHRHTRTHTHATRTYSPCTTHSQDAHSAHMQALICT